MARRPKFVPSPLDCCPTGLTLQPKTGFAQIWYAEGTVILRLVDVHPDMDLEWQVSAAEGLEIPQGFDWRDELQRTTEFLLGIG